MTKDQNEKLRKYYFKDKRGFYRMKGHYVVIGKDRIENYVYDCIKPSKKVKIFCLKNYRKTFGFTYMATVFYPNHVKFIKRTKQMVNNPLGKNGEIEFENKFVQKMSDLTDDDCSVIVINNDYGQWTYKNVLWHEIGHIEVLDNNGCPPEHSEYCAHKWALDRTILNGSFRLTNNLLKELDESWQFSEYNEHQYARERLLEEYKDYYERKLK